LAVEYYNHRLVEAEETMKVHKNDLRKLADLLKQKKTIYYEQVMECIGEVWDTHRLALFEREESNDQNSTE